MQKKPKHWSKPASVTRSAVFLGSIKYKCTLSCTSAQGAFRMCPYSFSGNREPAGSSYKITNQMKLYGYLVSWIRSRLQIHRESFWLSAAVSSHRHARFLPHSAYLSALSFFAPSLILTPSRIIFTGITVLSSNFSLRCSWCIHGLLDSSVFNVVPRSRWDPLAGLWVGRHAELSVPDERRRPLPGVVLRSAAQPQTLLQRLLQTANAGARPQPGERGAPVTQDGRRVTTSSSRCIQIKSVWWCWWWFTPLFKLNPNPSDVGHWSEVQKPIKQLTIK